MEELLGCNQVENPPVSGHVWGASEKTLLCFVLYFLIIVVTEKWKYETSFLCIWRLICIYVVPPVILSHILKPRLRPGSCQDGSLEQDSIWKWKTCRIHTLDAATPLRSAFSWGIAFAVSGGPGRAAGCRGRPADQWCGGDASNEADTAQPPSLWAPEGPQTLLLPPDGPSCFSPVCFRFDGTLNASFILLLYIRGEGKSSVWSL